MFREIIKGILMLSAAVSVVACSSNAAVEKAEELYGQSLELRKQGNYEGAIELLDSIDRAYPSAIDVRRKVTALRPLLMEQVTNRQLEIADSISALSSWRLDSMKKYNQPVSNVIENYFVPAAEGKINVAAVPGLHARMSPDGRFYIVATAPGHIGMTSVTVTSGSESASSPVISYDGERSDRSGANDVITFVEAECDGLGNFIMHHRDSPVSVTYSGKTSRTELLSANQKEGVALLYETASLVRECKKQEIEKQRLTRVLEVVRSQIARTASDSISIE